jgi:hypothetical protein
MSISEADALLLWPIPSEWMPHLVSVNNEYGAIYATFQLNDHRIKLIWLKNNGMFAGKVSHKHPQTRRWRGSSWKYYSPQNLAFLYQTWSNHDP